MRPVDGVPREPVENRAIADRGRDLGLRRGDQAQGLAA
jgi:hypothetical protein